MSLPERMWVTIAEHGIGGLLKPWQIRRVGRARTAVLADRLALLSRAAHDDARIQALREQLVLANPTSAPASLQAPETTATDIGSSPEESEFPRRLAHVMAAEEVRRQVNVTKALFAAEDVLEDDSAEPPSDKPDADWLFRWRDAACAVSQPELQQLWGRVLAGEIKSPGSFSLRTLQLLRNLSMTEANEIERLLQFAFDGLIYTGMGAGGTQFPGATAILHRHGVDHGFLLHMTELGIVTEPGGVRWTMGSRSLNEPSFGLAIRSGGQGLWITHANPNLKLTLQGVTLTKVAKEIHRIASVPSNHELLIQMGRDIQIMGFTVMWADFFRAENHQLHIRNERPLPAP